MAELMSGDQSREANPLLAANIKEVEDKIDELNNRLEKRRNEIERERFRNIADKSHLLSFIGDRRSIPQDKHALVAEYEANSIGQLFLRRFCLFNYNLTERNTVSQFRNSGEEPLSL